MIYSIQATFVHSWKKVVTPPFEAIKSNFYTSSGLKLTWNVPVTAALQRNPTLPWPDCHFTWDCRCPKRQHRWSFLQICLRTVASSNTKIAFFSQFSLIVLIMPLPTPIGIWLMLPSTASSGVLVPQELHTSSRLLCWEWLRPRAWRCGWGICMEWGSALVPWSPCYRPPRKPPLTANHHRLCLEWAQRWQNLTMAHWQHVIFGDESRFDLYLVNGRLRFRRLPGDCFQQMCQAYRVQAGSGSVHVWGAFHSGAKPPLAFPNRCLIDELYRGILQNTLVPFERQHNYRYQDKNATPHCSRVVLYFLKQGNATKMEQHGRSPDCNPIEHIWDEFGHAITSMVNPSQNLG